ncbi:hypothetical protein PV08_01829 [Exophiala spinifera]|uniref:Uncharacterized protein n=1 Tax=Exophiala spinifera TaxID=91928 RepID=A0A0D2CCM2_9EURO|nr:uncharacterized protein PV08_01829 [Exophiala spinifera]KIW21249.1 hypothetical protein PV08_01829 [Exophiala spinifera]
MDAYGSFAYLVDNLPLWKSNAQSLAAHASQKHAEFAADFTRLVHQVKPKRKKSASVASIRTANVEETQEEQENEESSFPNKTDINPLEAGNRYLYAQVNRKQKPETSIRCGASGPQKFRNKNQVVIYYDSHVQDELNTLVKSIGIGRNNLRKGKNSLSMERGFRLPPLRSAQESPSLNNLRSTTTIMSGKKAVESLVLKVADPDEAAFLQVDKELESIQSLCETAAHQFLRDGDCTAELNNIQFKMEAVLQQAASTAASLKQSKVQQQEFGPDLESEAESAPTTPVSRAYNYPSKSSNIDRSTYGIKTTLSDMRARGAFFGSPAIAADSDTGLMTDSIEVDDDSDQSSVQLDISQYRFARTRRTRI